MERRLLIPLIALAALALSACGGAPAGGETSQGAVLEDQVSRSHMPDSQALDATVPPVQPAEPNEPVEPAEPNEPDQPSAGSLGSGGTGSVEIDGVTWGFGSDAAAACRELIGLLNVNLDAVSRDGEAIDSDGGVMRLTVSDSEDVDEITEASLDVSVILPPDEGQVWLTVYSAGRDTSEPVTLIHNGYHVVGEQVLVDTSGELPPVTAKFDVRCGG